MCVVFVHGSIQGRARRRIKAIHLFETSVLFRTDEFIYLYDTERGPIDGWTFRIGCKGKRDHSRGLTRLTCVDLRVQQRTRAEQHYFPCRLTGLQWDACYDGGAPLFFSNSTPHFWSSRPPPKTGLEKNKTAICTGAKIRWLRYNKNENEHKLSISDDFGFRSPVIQKTKSSKKTLPLS